MEHADGDRPAGRDPARAASYLIERVGRGRPFAACRRGADADPHGSVRHAVTTKRPDLEEPSELEARIEEAARHVPLERLALSPQCGFASMMEGNEITPADQRRKLELVVSVAWSVWG